MNTGFRYTLLSKTLWAFIKRTLSFKREYKSLKRCHIRRYIRVLYLSRTLLDV